MLFLNPGGISHSFKKFLNACINFTKQTFDLRPIFNLLRNLLFPLMTRGNMQDLMHYSKVQKLL